MLHVLCITCIYIHISICDSIYTSTMYSAKKQNYNLHQLAMVFVFTDSSKHKYVYLFLVCMYVCMYLYLCPNSCTDKQIVVLPPFCFKYLF